MHVRRPSTSPRSAGGSAIVVVWLVVASGGSDDLEPADSGVQRHAEVRSVSEFDAVRVDSGVQVTLHVVGGAAGDVDLDVSAEHHLLDRLTTVVEDGTLFISFTGPLLGGGPTRPLEVAAEVGALRKVHALEGARVTLTGSVPDFRAEALGGASIDARSLEAGRVSVAVENGARATVCATDSVVGYVTHGASVAVACGGDFSGVATANAGRVTADS